ncbi:MAG: DUF2125 domain-containing protein, partial [Rubrivivax sp.]
AAPLQTEATLTVQQNESTDLPWIAVAAARGPLAKLTAKAELEAAHQRLTAEGEVRPFAAWPVNALQLKADKFDLAALATLSPGLPRTSLTGTAKLTVPALSAEATLQAEMRNDAPGRWDQGALPVKQLRLAVAGRPDQLTSLRLTALDAELAGGARVQGKGQRDATGRWQLDARVQGLRPEALDARATPARLDGPLSVSGGTQQPLAARLDLRGTLQQRPLRVQARVQGRLLEQGSSWQIEEARLTSGDAELQAKGSVDVTPAAQVAAKLQAQLRQFDPHLLWRGEPASAWARLPATRLNADATLDLRGSNLETLTGTVDARLLPSQFAGLAAQGQLSAKRGRTQDAAAFDADMRIGNNRVQANGEARPTAVTAQWKLQAPKLAELNPLLALFEQPSVTGQAEGDGSLQLARDSTAWKFGGIGKLAVTSLSTRVARRRRG